jgi:hypothetical protein
VAADRLAVESSNARTEHGDRNSHGSRVDEFRTAKLRAVAQTLLAAGVERRVITDYCDFTTGSAFSGDRSSTDARRAGQVKAHLLPSIPI